MTRIKKLRVKNFKKYAEQTFEFNDDINILVGDNECGKSSLLEAIELCLNFCHRGKPLTPEVMAELFNDACVQEYLKGGKSQDSLPDLMIEAYLEGNPQLRGTNNDDGVDMDGIKMHLHFDPELSESYAAFIAAGNVSTLPFELYASDWYSFAWNRLTQNTKGINCLFVDPTRLHPTFGRSRYINSIINSSIDRNARSTLNLNYRQLKVRFNDEKDVKAINDKLDADNDLTARPLKIIADIGSASSWECNLQLAVDDIPFPQIGKGQQNQLQIKIAIQNKAKDVDVVMLEEPENHLSHINLIQLVSYIETRNQGKQIFLTTHSSYVLNKLSIEKLCLLTGRQEKSAYTKLKNIDPETAKTLKRLPGYDTLRLVLAQKVVLVEGPSDELLLKKIYQNKHKRLPEEDGIDIIVVRGIGFKVYLDIAKALDHPVRVVKDNDGDYAKNIAEWLTEDYNGCKNIECLSPTDNSLNSLEPALIEANGGTLAELDTLAKVMLSAKTLGAYNGKTNLAEKKEFLGSWYGAKNSGGRKVDSAVRIFDSATAIQYPEYLTKAITFDA